MSMNNSCNFSQYYQPLQMLIINLTVATNSLVAMLTSLLASAADIVLDGTVRNTGYPPLCGLQEKSAILTGERGVGVILILTQKRIMHLKIEVMHEIEIFVRKFGTHMGLIEVYLIML